MRRTRQGIELQRGNIRVVVSETTAREGIAKLRENDARLANLAANSDFDPEGYISRASIHKVKGKRYAEPWRGSGATANPEVKRSFQARKDADGCLVQPGLTIEDALRLMQKPSM